jgi:ATP-dependent DNA helicase RecQ
MFRRDVPVPAARAAGRSGRGGAGAGAGSGSGPGRLEAADLSPEDTAVFETLRAWRGSCAKEQGVPAYVVFHDATLRQIAAVAPATLAELSEINGVGEAKLAKYGQQILDVLATGVTAAS